MVLHRASPVIPRHINGIGLHMTGRKGPVVRGMDVGFIQLLSIDKKLSVAEFDLFIFERDHSLQKRHSLSCETDDHDIPSFGCGKEVSNPPAEIESPILIGGFHAVTFDAEGGQQMSKDDIGKKSNTTCPDQKGRGQGWEKELAGSFIDRHGFSNPIELANSRIQSVIFSVSYGAPPMSINPILFIRLRSA